MKHNAVGGCRPKEKAIIDHRASASGGSWGKNENDNEWARQQLLVPSQPALCVFRFIAIVVPPHLGNPLSLSLSLTLSI